jgi:hypothetical protein
MARIIINPRLRRIGWFVGIYAASVVGFGIVVGVLELALPK